MNTNPIDYRDQSAAGLLVALFTAGAAVASIGGALRIKAKPGAVSRELGQAAAKARLALAVEVAAGAECSTCLAPMSVEETRTYRLVWCQPCGNFLAGPKIAGVPMGLWTDYDERGACRTCPWEGGTYNGRCLRCIEREEERAETAAMVGVPAPAVAVASTSLESDPDPESESEPSSLSSEPLGRGKPARCLICGMSTGRLVWVPELGFPEGGRPWRCEMHAARVWAAPVSAVAVPSPAAEAGA
jgi:hypothetical protein